MFGLVPWRKSEQTRMTPFGSRWEDFLERFWEMDIPGFADEAGNAVWMPRLDVSENDTHVTVRLEIPGVKRDDLDISLKDRVLTVRGRRDRSHEEKRENFHRVERVHGSFQRSVTLPADVNPDGASAVNENGVLRIVLEKKEPGKPRKIEIKTR